MSELLAHELTGPADAPVLVLGGSLGTTREMWRPQLPRLAEHFRVLAFDHRGHGASPVPPGPYRIADLGGDVLALLEALGVERFGYAGLSLGGMVGMWLAAQVPERVDRLALLCTSAHLPPAQAWLARAAQVRAEGTGTVAAAVVQRWFTAGFRAGQPLEVAPLTALLAATPAEGYAGCCEAIAEMDLRPVLSRITASTLVIAGADDPATPPQHARDMVARIAGARLVILDDAAHLASVEQPAAVTRLLLDHFRQV